MMNKILTGLMLLVLFNESTLANATPPSMTFDSTGTVGTFGNNNVIGASFTDLFTFNAPQSQSTNYAPSIQVTSSSNLNISSFTLTDPFKNTTVITGSFTANYFGQQASFITLTAGSTYDLSITGTNNSGTAGNYSGILSLNPVPEPSEWLLMLMGFGLTGFVARRLKNGSSKIFMAA